MYYNSIYSQLFNFIPRYRFEKIVKKSDGDRYCKHFTAWKQFLTLLFAQISGKDSVREIENALPANHCRHNDRPLPFSLQLGLLPQKQRGSWKARKLTDTAEAPDIVEAIVAGAEPDGLSIAQIMKNIP